MTAVGWCPFCGAVVREITTTDGRGFCEDEPVRHGLVWPETSPLDALVASDTVVGEIRGADEHDRRL